MEDKLHLMTTILKVTDFHEKRSTVHKRMHYNVSVGLCHALVDLKRNSWEARMEASLKLHGANKNCNDKNHDLSIARSCVLPILQFAMS